MSATVSGGMTGGTWAGCGQVSICESVNAAIRVLVVVSLVHFAFIMFNDLCFVDDLVLMTHR